MPYSSCPRRKVRYSAALLVAALLAEGRWAMLANARDVASLEPGWFRRHTIGALIRAKKHYPRAKTLDTEQSVGDALAHVQRLGLRERPAVAQDRGQVAPGQEFHDEEGGGAGAVVVGHGSSNAKAVKNGILVTARAARENVSEIIAQTLAGSDANNSEQVD